MPTIKNVKYDTIRAGKGDDIVNESHSCFVTMNIRLNKGQLVRKLSDYEISYNDRNVIAGVRYGILGMACGEIRKLIIPPHLGYGNAGLPDHVPPHSVLKILIKVNRIIKE